MKENVRTVRWVLPIANGPLGKDRWKGKESLPRTIGTVKTVRSVERVTVTLVRLFKTVGRHVFSTIGGSSA